MAEAVGELLADESHCYLTHQPEGGVVCERLDSVPMWLEAVWNEEIDASLRLLSTSSGVGRLS
jgi:hypothetical protein